MYIMGEKNHPMYLGHAFIVAICLTFCCAAIAGQLQNHNTVTTYAAVATEAITCFAGLTGATTAQCL